MKKFIALGFLMAVSEVFADYIRIGPMMATVCTGLVIKSCKKKEISAIEERGKFYEPSKIFKSVDSFSGKTCTIMTSSNNVVTSAALAAKLPNFYTLTPSGQVKIKPDHVHFNCQKR